MKLTRTIIFTLLFVVAAAIYLFQARLTRQSLTIIPDEVNRTVAISRNDPVDRVELRDSVQQTEVALRKENGAWALERPVRYPAEGRVAEGFVIAARMASLQPRLRAEKEWGEYGLEKPELEIRYEIPGKGMATLLIGARAPIGKAVFARWREERGFFLLPPEMKAMFRQSVYALREKRLFRGPADGMRKIYVEMGQHSYEWRKDEGAWYWLEPVTQFGRKVPAERMELVLEGLRGLHVREFLDNNKKSKAGLGFFVIHDRIWVEYENGKRESFYFGNEVPDRNAYYGLLEGENVVFLVDRANVIGFFDYLRKIQPEEPKVETKDLRSRI